MSGLTSDKRQEANAALLEVDKGLRSSRPGEQCEAIVRFPNLMDRFPFPILINVAFLKLADVFRTGSNLLRLNILKVVQLTEKHLNKITSTDEFFKRISAVIHSNDPIARALTLRMFAATSTLVAERKTVHHSIQRSLESHDQVEVEAAIFATDALCRHSSVFASGVYEKIADMVQGLKTPPDMKLKLIPVLRKMHHNLQIASQVREVCLQLLTSHPTLTFVIVVLPTLTELSVATLVQASDQIQLLLTYAEEDVRKAIRQLALHGLHKLSLKTPQCWTTTAIENLLAVIDKAKHDREKEIGCQVLYNLSSSLAAQQMTSLLESIKPLCYEVTSVTRAYATATCSNIILAVESKMLLSECMDLSDRAGTSPLDIKELMHLAIEVIVTADFSEADSKSVKVLLSCLVELAKKCIIEEELVIALTSQLSVLPVDCYSILCKAITAMATNGRGERGRKVTHHLLQFLQREDSDILLHPLSSMLLELHSSSYSSTQYVAFVSQVQPILLEYVWNINEGNKFWQAYKIARRGTKMGFHSFSRVIYKKLHKKMINLNFKKWLQTLEQFSHAQSIIADAHGEPSQLVSSLQTASSFLYDCTLLVKGSGQSSSLPTQFLPCIAGLLDTYSQLISLCITHRSLLSPSLVLDNTLINKFKEIAAQFRSVSKHFSVLSQSLFDADPSTLEYIKLLQQSCTLISNIISTVISPQKPLLSPVTSATTPIFPTTPVSLDTTDDFNTDYTLGNVCNKVLSKVQSAALSLQSQSFSLEHLSVIEKSALSMVDVPLLLPPSFFVSYQFTSIQLALSPALPSLDQPISVTLGDHLALKVEGVVEHYGKKIHRSPAAVFVQVAPKVDKLFDVSFKLPKLQELEQTPSVKNDYFIAEFLLSLPTAGQYIVTIENSLVDDDGKIWHTGPRVEMNLIVDTEEKLKTFQQQQYQSSRSEPAASVTSHYVKTAGVQW